MNKIVFLLLATLSLSVAAFAAPNKLVDDEWVIKPLMMKGSDFTLKEAKPVKVTIEGIQDAKKGFTVWVLPAKEFRDFVANKVTKKGLADYPHTLKLLYQETLKLDPGEWAIMVENSENTFKSLSVRVTIVVDPKEE